MNGRARQVFDRLLAAYGPQQWWPAESKLEMIVGAVLVQNTAWTRVEAGLASLKARGLLDLAALDAVSNDELSEVIRPVGYFRVKARRLKNLVAFIRDEYGLSLERLFAADLATLRAGLLSVNGVGPETADCIVLYGAELPTFVIDAYTHRVFSRHRWVAYRDGYDVLKHYFESQLAPDVALYNEYHALLVRVGNRHCRATPKCETCPLADWLPEGGAYTPA